MPDPIRWSVMWRTADGDCHIVWDGCLPLLFRTKADAAKYIRHRWGYIATRTYLRRPPHNWRMPRPVKVRVILEVIDA